MPVVVDLAAPVPVLAAGGIADGRGVAAALALGAAGALISTRFQSTAEAPVDPSITEAIIRGRGQDTERSSVLDIARESGWPAEYTARTLGHPYLDRRRGREAELAADPGPGRPTGPMWHAALCRRCRCGRVKASTSSPTGLPRLLSSPHWPLRPTTPWPELRDAERLLRAGLEGSVISLTAIGDLHVPDSREHLADKTEFVRLEPGV
ncbi:nitronate monooxygenase [Streptomyces sp. NPDC002573]|uniref:nitronate monooxygenase n=1 Tax=Streptomyces sp. NPDC002573 TaxID=3364651 RepID=UPI00368B4155